MMTYDRENGGMWWKGRWARSWEARVPAVVPLIPLGWSAAALPAPSPEATFPVSSWNAPSIHALSDLRASVQSIYILPAGDVLHTHPYLVISQRLLRLSLGRN